MTVKHAGAIYATKSKLLLRIYVPDESDDEINRQHVGPGETLVRVPIEVFRSGDHRVVQAHIGEPAHSGVCAVVHKDTGRVIDRIVADPDLYRHPDGHHVIQSDEAEHDDRWDGQRFLRGG
jgi:hypothetical protein